MFFSEHFRTEIRSHFYNITVKPGKANVKNTLGNVTILTRILKKAAKDQLYFKAIQLLILTSFSILKHKDGLFKSDILKNAE